MGQNDMSKVERYALKNVKDHVGIHVGGFVTMTSSEKKIVSNDQVKDPGFVISIGPNNLIAEFKCGFPVMNFWAST